jgi:RimJ/RimL family protein N-acetyltransferase
MGISRLVPVGAHHLAFIHEQAARPENAEFFRRNSPVNLWPKDTLAWWGNAFIVESAEEKPLGMLSLSNIDAQNRQLEFGVFLDKEACKPASRREVAVDAIAQFLEYTFDYLQYEKVYSRTLEHREAVFGGYEQYGFTQDAVLRNNVWWQGEWHNEVIYSLLSKEWQTALKPKLQQLEKKAS